MNPSEVASIAKDTCLTALKNPHKTHEDVGEDVYRAVLEALAPRICSRCGNPFGGYSHGPGFCIDRHENLRY